MLADELLRPLCSQQSDGSGIDKNNLLFGSNKNSVRKRFHQVAVTIFAFAQLLLRAFASGDVTDRARYQHLFSRLHRAETDLYRELVSVFVQAV